MTSAVSMTFTGTASANSMSVNTRSMNGAANESNVSANTEVYGGDKASSFFTDLMQQALGDTQGSEDQTERLEMIQSAVDDMDESEVAGFLAMLDGQTTWNTGQMALPSGFREGEMALNPLQMQQLGLSAQAEEPGLANTLKAGAQEALNLARENYQPAGREQETVETARQPLANGVLQAINRTQTDLQKTTAPFNPELTSLGSRTDLLTSSASSDGNAVPDIQMLDAGRIAPAQDRGEFARTVQTTSEYLADNRQTVDTQQPKWGEALGQRLMMMATEQRQEAQIRLDPPELGSLGVKLVVEDRGVSVQFHSAIPQVRDMLETQADRLRIALSSQGLDLVGVNVGDDAQSQSNERQSSYLATSGADGMDSHSEEALSGHWVEAEVPLPTHNHLINTFA